MVVAPRQKNEAARERILDFDHRKKQVLSWAASP